MPKRRAKTQEPAVPSPDVPSAPWDFTQLLNTDIRNLEVADSLRQLGKIRVIDWDFKTVIPAVKKTANREVDVIDIIKRTANYKIMEWDFRSPSRETPDTVTDDPVLSPELQALGKRLQEFLQYVAANLIDEPTRIRIRVEEIAPKVLRFNLTLAKRDVAMLIGREGFTATAIRTVMKSVAETHGVNVLLQIQSHEEELTNRAKERRPT